MPMDINAALEITELALGLVTALVPGKPAADADIATELVRIATAVNQAHNDLVGTPIDPASLTIEPEA